MIPFARIVKYGNTVLPPKLSIKQLSCGSTHRALLYSDGELYTAGNGVNYKLGTGTTTNYLQAWQHVNSDVDFVASGNNCTLIRKKDGTYWHCGAKEAVYGVTSNNQIWTDCSVLFSTIQDSIVDISVGNFSTIVQTSTGDLYGIGSNNDYALGMSGVQTSFVKIAEGVSKWSYTRDACMYIKNGSMYRAGSNSSSKLGVVSSGIVVPFTEFQNPTGLICVDVCMQSDAIYVLYRDNSNVTHLYNCGNNAGNLGRGNTSNVTTISEVPNWSGKVVKFYNKLGIGNAIFHYIGTDNIYSAGYNPSGQVGVGSTGSLITTYTRSIGLPSLSNIQSIQIMGSNNTFAVCDDGVYWCGAAANANGTVNSTSFAKLPIPIQI